MTSTRSILAVEALVPADTRREADAALDVATAAKKPITVMDHGKFRESITGRPARAVDPIDELLAELRTINP